MFIYVEREREHTCVLAHNWGRGKEGEKIPSRLRAVSTEPDSGLRLTNQDIMT